MHPIVQGHADIVCLHVPVHEQPLGSSKELTCKWLEAVGIERL